jgi:2-polyprenyl-6-methoxyphenol hydroxylase-like FAD-dependent oxidoreductase
MRTVLISGAGIAGPALAYWLLKYGFEPTIVESAPRFRDGGYMIDVWGTGYDLIERFGLMQQVRDRAYVFDKLKFVDQQGKRLSGFGGEVFRRALGGRFFSIPRGDLAHALFDSIEDRVEILYGNSIARLQPASDGVVAEFMQGEPRGFDLVIGADGLHSRVRELAFGPEAQFEKYLGFCAASFITDDYPHRDEGTYVSFAQPGRQISRYAMRGGRTAFLLVFAADNTPKIAAHDTEGQKQLLRAKFGGDGWESREILARLDAADDLYFDAVSQIRMPQWSRGRVALLGDAGYCPSLLAGAGSAFAMLGAYVLAGELRNAHGDPALAFAAYEAKLRGWLTKQQDAAVGLAASFTPKTAFGLRLRDWVVNLMNIPPLGAFLARSMLGKPFVLPDYG